MRMNCLERLDGRKDSRWGLLIVWVSMAASKLMIYIKLPAFEGDGERERGKNRKREGRKIEMVTFKKQIMMGTSRVLNKTGKRKETIHGGRGKEMRRRIETGHKWCEVNEGILFPLWCEEEKDEKTWGDGCGNWSRVVFLFPYNLRQEERITITSMLMRTYLLDWSYNHCRRR